jgi:hypothetical protein
MAAMPLAAEAAEPGVRSIVESLAHARRRPKLIGGHVRGWRLKLEAMS